jgi:FkbM family methyltransferase
MVLIAHGLSLSKRRDKKGRCLRSYRIICIFIFFSYLLFLLERQEVYKILAPPRNHAPSAKQRAEISGWDAKGLRLYEGQKEWLKTLKTVEITIPPLNKILVNEESNTNAKFWDRIDGKLDWEPSTFAVFQKYVTNETIVIDFGAWIGPTLLFHGQLSRHSYGIEADPKAYATLETNVLLNPNLPVSVTPACISAPQDVGLMLMKGKPGASMSGISEKLAVHPTSGWKVRCYTLPTVLERWGIDIGAQPVMIKIDVESYECKLVPAFYDWLKDIKRLPTIYVSFHPQISDCLSTEWEAILKVLRLYQRIFSHSGTKEMQLAHDISVAEFQHRLNKSKDASVFLLAGGKHI